MKNLLSLLPLLFIATTLPAQLIGDTENGLASYYSREYDGAETAYDLIYNRNDMVAAHKTFPVNSTVEVKNLDNGKAVRVRIIDKGPFIRGRVIEVSERAAEGLGLIGLVTAPVEVTLVSLKSDEPADREVVTTAEPDPVVDRPVVVVDKASPDPPAPVIREKTTTPVKPAAAPEPAPEPAVAVTTIPTAPAPAPIKIVAVATPAPRVPVPSSATRPKMATDFAPGVYKIALSKKPAGNFAVQVGSFRDLEGAMDKVTELQGKWFDDVLLERVTEAGASLYKVLLGPFESADSAKRYASDLKKRYAMAGFTVTLK
ncbi:septal ring lytic transglycosylase RlpA family protein [Neolewinella antarctica]|uniref:Rare lipoprotein A n=1 Tax=Neolewinella antarctica TaxID=442734 RepID=A0ABX0XBN8_9BACT|nr:septal ring lytic transglycosylase RlpA family protein [Neolewinella antarctica]NJC26359.1 rare lipoprotein A [Neolewinella antarctica]